MNLSTKMALLAGAVVGLHAACAQEQLTPAPLGPQYRMSPEGVILGEIQPGYDSRAFDYGYSNYVFDGVPNSPAGSTGGRDIHYLEDIDFTPGPWANAATRAVERIKFSILRNTAVTQSATDILYKFWDRDDVVRTGFTGAGTAMINPAATPLGQLRFGLPTLPQNLIYGFAVTGLNPTVALPAGEPIFLEASLVVTGSTPGTLITTDHLRLPLANTSGLTTNAAVRGTTVVEIEYDTNRDGIFMGAAAINNATDRRGYAFGSLVAGLDVAIGGEIPATAPSCTSFTLGADNTFASANLTLTQNTPTWYCVDLSTMVDVIDENNRYIDFDTEGSTVDTAIGVFAADGTLLGSDTAGGSGTNAQLSFGMGRRAATGDGLDYDGRNYTAAPALLRGLGAGVYYVAVAPDILGVTFAGGFSVTCTGDSGAAVLRVRTNASGGTLEASAAPTATRVVGLGGEDPIIAPGGQVTANLDGPGVLWYSVQICRDSSATEQVTFDMTGASAATLDMYLFNSSGNLVTQVEGTNAAPPIATFADSPVLPAGTYYVATTYGPAAINDLSGDPANAGRWHVRGRNGSRGFAFPLQVSVPWADCGSGGCTISCDYNDDGGGDNADVIDLADAIAAGTDPFPNHCKDFNQDGGADNADVIDVAGAIASGTCP